MREQITLTVASLSNVKLCNVASIDEHPTTACWHWALRATSNSDDPAYFGGYITTIRAAAAGRGLSRDQLATPRATLPRSFLSEAEKARHLARLDAYLASA